MAFDTGPGNVFLDWCMNEITSGEKQYDEDGKFASRGTISEILLDEMLSLPYFELRPPKSTGRELFNSQVSCLLHY